MRPQGRDRKQDHLSTQLHVTYDNMDVPIEPSNYSKKENWLRYPDSIEHDVDIIYFYPTTFMPSEPDGKCTIDDEGMRAGANVAYSQQATAFEGLGNMVAPFYRQLDARSLIGLDQRSMAVKEMKEPMVDCFAALDHYFRECNDGRPFILAGHSQGSMMIMIILSIYMRDNPQYYSRMIAAYMIGNAATREWLSLNDHIRMAESADDLGVVVSWNTEGPDNKGKYNMVVPEGSICINPLNWRIDDTYADVSENKGSMITDKDGKLQLVPGMADARVDVERGSVIVTSVDKSLAVPAVDLFGPESYHSNDYEFFYQNIRENAELRIRTALKKM